jgi:carboxymethylenebutenolidase
MRAFVARPEKSGKRPGLLLCQEAYGVNAHIRDVAQRFAREGYVAIAPELFHRTAPTGFEAPYDKFALTQPHMQALTTENLEADVRAAHAWLTQDSGTDPNRIVAVGFCMGGRVSYIAATSIPLKAAVSFYGGGIAPALVGRAPRAQAPILFFWGARDTHIPDDQRRAIVDALATAGKSYVAVVFSDSGHAFFCDARPSYHRPSATEAWALTLAFLANHIG